MCRPMACRSPVTHWRWPTSSASGKEPNTVSLAAARNAGVIDDEDRAASPPKKRGMLASLFGFGKKQNEKPAAPVRETIAIASAPHAPPPITVATERIVPMPKGRPVAVAAVTPVPAPRPVALASLEPNVIANRGLWPLVETGPALRGPVEVASADPAVTGATSALAYAADRAPPARRANPMGTALAQKADRADSAQR